MALPVADEPLTPETLTLSTRKHTLVSVNLGGSHLQGLSEILLLEGY